jgi:hypothetical protein
MTVLACLAVGEVVQRGARHPIVQSHAMPVRFFRIGRGRSIVFSVVLLSICAYSLVPLISLIRQAGGGESWSIARLLIELDRAASLQWDIVLDSLIWACVAGLLAASIALFTSWMALDSPWIRRLLFALVVALWATPGPVLGFGLKETIDLLMDIEDALLAWTSARPIRAVPTIFNTAAGLCAYRRLFPYAMAIICRPFAIFLAICEN